MSAQPRTGSPQPGPPRPARAPNPADYRWRALAVCLVAGFMTMLDVSIVNVALPSLKAGLHASSDDLQWVLSGYALAFGLVLVPAGRLGDIHGRRAAFMTGLAAFTLTSAAAGLATGPGWLVAARFAQGLASGVLNPQVAGLIQQLFQGRERGRAFGMLGAVIGISTALGPLLGGLLIAAGGPTDGWRWVFYVNVPIGLAALPAAYRLLPSLHEIREHERAGGRAQGRTSGAARPEGLDPVGVLLLAAGVVAMLLPLVEEQQWHSRLKWLLLPLAALFLAAFVPWERRRQGRAGALVDLTLFRLRSYSLGSAIALVYFAGFTAIFFIFTLYVQAGLGYSALLAGAAITPFAVGSGIASALGGRVVTRFGRPLIAAGLLLVGLGLGATLLAVHLVPGREVGWVTLGPLAVAGLGSGLVIAPNQAITLSEVPVRDAGSAAGVLQTGQRIGSAVGIAVVGSVFFAALGPASAGAAGAAGGGVPHDPARWAHAFQRGLVVAIALVALALLVALYDVAATHRRDADAAADHSDDAPAAARG
ncbi:MFS transporter [Actinocrinis puniceicyclus]|uniref:MFS transporter n=1 Tax=Actinocrinis puniceicyclus TaxID=977794 RepID=A0A8J8BCP4_9ACTN|nr:MFS transporter [Actinocrinis puniceicyclus]MBS2961989.1 MFS transporter [Actinocrinis puniceicyclus]